MLINLDYGATPYMAKHELFCKFLIIRDCSLIVENEEVMCGDLLWLTSALEYFQHKFEHYKADLSYEVIVVLAHL